MELLVSSIHCSGNHFTMDLLPFRFQSAYVPVEENTKRQFHITEPDKDLLHALWNECRVIVPIRDKESTRLSWEKRGIPNFDYWWQKVTSLSGVFYFEIGSDRSLKRLSDLLAVELKTDWSPVNNLVLDDR